MRTSLLAILIAVLSFASAYGQYNVGNFDTYKYSQDGSTVPDVDKVGVPIPGVAANDMSCWQAAASNVLAAAGYGIGLTSQQRADNIYNQLTVPLGKANQGNCERAINWWLYTFGKNPNAPEYQPTNAYTDVTVVDKGPVGGLTYVGLNNDYDHLLNELKRCQYVAVSFYAPEHCMTLVGGNSSGNPNMQPDGNVSIWHDSDLDMADTVVTVDDDVYINAPDANGFWTLQNYVTQKAVKYTTLCPGLNKPEAAVRNYDVAYYMQALDPDLMLNDPAFREAGAKAPVYMDPSWLSDTLVQIGNEELPNMKKELYLLVDYTDRVADRLENVLLQVMDPSGLLVDLQPTSITSSDDDGQLLFSWLLDFQPGLENILFPDNRYSTLTGNVKDWNLATNCVPEPSTLLLLLGAAAAWCVIVRRQKAM